jgi:lambda repressor-like predicted transcriptional regulator
MPVSEGRRPVREEDGTAMSMLDGIGAQGASAMSLQTAGSQGVQGGHRGHHREGGALQSAAKALGMDVKDVVAALKDGKSLDDLAQQQGVSDDDLVAAIRSDLPQRLQQSGDADQVAESIATRTGPPRGPQRADGPPQSDGDAASASSVSGVLGSSLNPTQQATLDGLSSLLGTTSDDLLSSLRSGTSLADLVDAQGVDRDSLASVMQDGLIVDTTA